MHSHWRQKERQKDGQMDRQANEWMDGQTHRQTATQAWSQETPITTYTNALASRDLCCLEKPSWSSIFHVFQLQIVTHCAELT